MGCLADPEISRFTVDLGCRTREEWLQEIKM
jgi:hypothetical protein